MNFKDALKNDIDNTFLNSDEFSNVVNFSGLTINAVKDFDKFQSKLKNGAFSFEFGTFMDGFTLYVKKSDLNNVRPLSGDRIMVDGVLYEVVMSKEDFLMYELDLVADLDKFTGLSAND